MFRKIVRRFHHYNFCFYLWKRGVYTKVEELEVEHYYEKDRHRLSHNGFRSMSCGKTSFSSIMIIVLMIVTPTFLYVTLFHIILPKDLIHGNFVSNLIVGILIVVGYGAQFILFLLRSLQMKKFVEEYSEWTLEEFLISEDVYIRGYGLLWQKYQKYSLGIV